jgi:hypothetical protein
VGIPAVPHRDRQRRADEELTNAEASTTTVDAITSQLVAGGPQRVEGQLVSVSARA